MNNNFGNKIKEIRKNNNITQKELADKLNVTYQAVSKWERGENYPDILIIKEISSMFKIDINELMDIDGYKKNNKNYLVYVLISILIIVIVIISIFIFNHDNKLELKNLSTTCSEFKINGSIAYNNDKTSIHISSIDYCGVDEKEVYKSLRSILYESNNNDEILISESEEYNNLTIKDFLSDYYIHVDNYKKTCKLYTDTSLYIKLILINSNNKEITYTIPLSLKDECN